jgi:hypothetical protein
MNKTIEMDVVEIKEAPTFDLAPSSGSGVIESPSQLRKIHPEYDILLRGHHGGFVDEEMFELEIRTRNPGAYARMGMKKDPISGEERPAPVQFVLILKEKLGV